MSIKQSKSKNESSVTAQQPAAKPKKKWNFKPLLFLLGFAVIVWASFRQSGGPAAPVESTPQPFLQVTTVAEPSYIPELPDGSRVEDCGKQNVITIAYPYVGGTAALTCDVTKKADGYDVTFTKNFNMAGLASEIDGDWSSMTSETIVKFPIKASWYRITGNFDEVGELKILTSSGYVAYELPAGAGDLQTFNDTFLWDKEEDAYVVIKHKNEHGGSGFWFKLGPIVAP
jgi:hypothetical protein